MKSSARSNGVCLRCPLLAAIAVDDIGDSSTRTDVIVIAGVIAAIAFVLTCLVIVMLRYLYRHKGTYHTNEAKGTEFAENADTALKNDPALQEAVDESKKEYFI
ncbi:glycophorin-C isoform X1 [Alligator mississippiensis]|uniref:glycophorin-C isoform X1 n=1 Tax=Alligator mississippiensis TaxID=8496 RepID=UPI00090715D7|nr:glycophorin-C isoform X1 [Alligator mississippiensis]